ncbi:hypothetical protein KIW84_077113 [Lathyrus oleraceus]|uniref:Uncharacterized protein n=1 Tax=Pisum sativum TaxID=3888 RepID=A0A9D4W157_PEA|nr:hypothetical protein KIW84_077113 [Pisum sativum]
MEFCWICFKASRVGETLESLHRDLNRDVILWRKQQKIICKAKANAKAKFDETVEAHIKPGIDSKRTELVFEV